jgi:hypothetical protein
MLAGAVFAGSYFADKWDAKAWLSKLMNKDGGETTPPVGKGN